MAEMLENLFDFDTLLNRHWRRNSSQAATPQSFNSSGDIKANGIRCDLIALITILAANLLFSTTLETGLFRVKSPSKNSYHRTNNIGW
mmetsp:Transcript_16938/g.36968  ORF Transcript_16938/g.36968 Transcript_16938/m.36968 type:complete len:88 (-) Transcript_16938:249-512(-)